MSEEPTSTMIIDNLPGRVSGSAARIEPDNTSLSDRLNDIAARWGMIDASACRELSDIARGVRRLERFADEVVADARADELLEHGLRPVSEVVEPLVERARRLGNLEGPLR